METLLTTLAALSGLAYTHRRGFRIRSASRIARALRIGVRRLAR